MYGDRHAHVVRGVRRRFQLREPDDHASDRQKLRGKRGDLWPLQRLRVGQGILRLHLLARLESFFFFSRGSWKKKSVVRPATAIDGSFLMNSQDYFLLVENSRI